MRSLVPLPALTLILAVAAKADPTPRLTTDSPDYCRQLALRLERLPAHRRQAVLRLGEEGLRLCGAGQVRRGIARLRWAIRAAQTAE